MHFDTYWANSIKVILNVLFKRGKLDKTLGQTGQTLRAYTAAEAF